MIGQVSKDECCGCEACRQICPRNCIEMEADEEGFLYPQLKDGCILCGACLSSCPVYKESRN